MLYRKKWPLLIFLIPAFIFMIIFLYYPFIVNIFNSFFNMDSIVPIDAPFIGMKNYEKMIQDPYIHTALINSFILMGFTILFQVGFALLLAVLVDNIKKQSFYRVTFFFPIVVSATAIGLMFSLFYNYDGGMLNQLMLKMGSDKVQWLAPDHPLRTFLMVCIPVIWQYIGFYFVIMMTGLNNISDDVYEAASIDGATGFKKVIYITIPLLRNVIMTALTLAITGALKVFDLPWVLVPRGAPQGITHFLGTYMYEKTFVTLDYDYGSAIAILIVVLGVVISQATNLVLKTRDE